MLLSKKLVYAFQNPTIWIPFYTQINDLFCEHRIKAIHDAKTIAVAHQCLIFVKIDGIEIKEVFSVVKFTFSKKRGIALSDIIDLSSIESFKKSIRRLDTVDDWINKTETQVAWKH
jgi:hypothetical protein